MIVYWLLFPWNPIPVSLCKPGLCCRGNQPHRFHFFRSGYANFASDNISLLSKNILALTEGIKEDWGGKPFVDLRNGWKYVLENYPQVAGIGTSILDVLLTLSTRLTLTAQSLLARAMEVTPSSRLYLNLQFQGTLTTNFPQLDSRKPRIRFRLQGLGVS